MTRARTDWTDDMPAWEANILRTYDASTADMRTDGARWYPAMAEIMSMHAAESGLSVAKCAAIYAANSINTPWSRNIALGARAIADHIDGLPALANGGTLGMIVRKCRAIIDARTDDEIDTILSADAGNLKIKNFRRNLAGDYRAVTVDRWAMRIAYGLTDGGYVPTGAEYQAIAQAYVNVADRLGIAPATLQAVTWCVIRGTGE